MFAFLPSTEEVIRVDGRMSESIRGLEEVPIVPTTSQPVRARRRAVPLHCGLASSSQRGLGTDDGRSQRPVYFVSRAFRGAEERYPRMEKLALALMTAARKLKPYFQAHVIIVLTDQPLKKAMSSPEAAGRMALWAIELS